MIIIGCDYHPGFQQIALTTASPRSRWRVWQVPIVKLPGYDN